MALVAFDTNVLIYAVDSEEFVKRPIAQDLLMRAAHARAVLLQQAIGEFFAVCRRRSLVAAPAARCQIEAWALLMDLGLTTPEHLMAASRLAEANGKQFWDMVLLASAADAGVDALLSEDIGDREVIDGVRVLNPFNPANAAEIDALLTASS